MASDKHPKAADSNDERTGGAATGPEAWIFGSEQDALPTEKLPDREDFERIRLEKAKIDADVPRPFAPLGARDEEPSAPEVPTVGSDGDAELSDTADEAEFGESAESAASEVDPGGVGSSSEPPTVTDPVGIPAKPTRADSPEHDAAARSGSTPSAAPRPAIQVPERFRNVSGWDALRDLLVVLCFGTSFSTIFADRWGAVSMLFPRIAAGVGILAIVAVYVLRWAPTYRKDFDPNAPMNLGRLGLIRKLGMVPAFIVSIGLIGYDLVMSVPDLLVPLPDGPRVGIGVGASLLLLGAIVGSERRGFEGFSPDETHKARATTRLAWLRNGAYASFIVAIIMMVGKALHGDLLFSVMTLARSIGALALVSLIINPALRRTPSWFVFLTGAAGAMVVGGAADNTLRLEFAAPASFSTAYVWLPFVFAAFGILVSRAYVRSTKLRFSRVDWIVYAARAFEFSSIMHSVALAIVTLQAGAIIAGYDGQMGWALAAINILFVAAMLGLSILARRSLSYLDATKARSHAVSASVGLAVVGFVGILLYSIASGAAAGLTNGGLALVIGICAALMLTVPQPLPDEYGAPNLSRSFAAFRDRETVPEVEPESALDYLPDTAAQNAERKEFPA